MNKYMFLILIVNTYIQAEIIYMTAYSATRNQTDSTPCISADMTNICKLYKRGICTIALSRDLLKKYPYGTKVILDNKTICIVHDTMNKRWRKRGDMFTGSGKSGYHKMLKWKNHYSTIKKYNNKKITWLYDKRYKDQ